jgi:hypothetical protein
MEPCHYLFVTVVCDVFREIALMEFDKSVGWSFVTRTIVFSFSRILGAAHSREISKRFSKSLKLVGFSISITKGSVSDSWGSGEFLCAGGLIATKVLWRMRSASRSWTKRCCCSLRMAERMLLRSVGFFQNPRHHCCICRFYYKITLCVVLVMYTTPLVTFAPLLICNHRCLNPLHWMAVSTILLCLQLAALCCDLEAPTKFPNLNRYNRV